MAFSRTFALAGGVLLPLAETARRWHQLSDWRMFPFWFDDWVIGFLLLYGFWRTREGTGAGQPVLAAAWGFACGMAYGSFFSQLESLNTADPSGLPSITVVAIKGLMLALALVALLATLRWKPQSR